MLHLLALILSHMFFRKITISGKPYTGKTALWVVNHSNGIVDPTVLLALSPVLLRPLAKAPLWNNLVMRVFLKITRAIPVARTQDVEEMFKNERPADPAAWQKKVNEEAFKAVNKALVDGEHILIFPEGVSHDDAYLHAFKTGVARMAVQAAATLSSGVSPAVEPRDDTSGKSTVDTVTIQPVIIDYSEKNEFRSALYIQYCDPVTVTAKDTSVPNIMEKMTASFKKHFVEFKTWDEKRNWQFLFKIFYGREPDSLKEFHDFVEKNRNPIEQDVVLFGKIQTMRCMLQASGISPCSACWRNAARGQGNWMWFLMFILRILSYTFIKAPLTLLFTLVWGIPLELCHFLGGNNKKYHRDVYATLEIANAMWILPVWASFLISGNIYHAFF